MKTLTNKRKWGLLILAGLFQNSWCQAQAAAPMLTNGSNSLWFNGAFIILFLTIVILLCVIAVLGKIVKTMIEEDTKEMVKNRLANKVLTLVALLTFVTSIASAAGETKPVVASSPLIAGMDQTLFWVMIATIVMEFAVVLMLLNTLYSFLVRKGLILPFASQLPSWLQWNKMVGNDLPVEKDVELLTDHDYDGIQELDNGMPPMLKYIFVATVAAAFIYWGHYETFGTGPTQLQEYEAELVQAEVDKAEYLKKAGNLVDETTAKLVEDAASLGSGQKIYTTNCVACHGDKGQGGVGPNLTDAYWIHGGDIQSLFKTIKYGVAAKGMRAWQSEIKPGDIQNVASYILKEFGGKNVAGGKAPQGDLVNAQPTATADSSAVNAPKGTESGVDSTSKK